MNNQKFLILFLITCIALVSIPVVLGQNTTSVVYVAGDGSGDFNCDGKADQIEINQALKFVKDNPGYTTVHLKGPFTYILMSPLYIENNTTLEGDSNAVIKLMEHAGWTNNPMIPLIGQNGPLRNITIRGFEIDGNHNKNTEYSNGQGFYNLIYFTGAKNITVNDMYLHDCQGDGLRISSSENVKFYNNKISMLGHDGLYATGCKDVEAWNNKILCRTNSGLRIANSNNVKLHDNLVDSYPDAGPGIQIQRSTGKMKNIEIYNNLIKNSWGPGIWVIGNAGWVIKTAGAYDKSLSDCHIHHNTFIDCGKNRNIEWVGGVVGNGYHNVLIENNVFDGTRNAAVVIMNMTDTDEGAFGKGFTTTVRNNIIANTIPRTLNGTNTGYGASNCLPHSHIMVLENNCFYNNSAVNYKNCSSKTDIYANPLFADEEKHIYHLQSSAGRWNGKGWIKDKVTSKCIDSGTPSSKFSNEPEPNGNRINIGPDGNTKYASKSVSGD